MRLLFFYTRDRSSNAKSFATEGLYSLFTQMVERKIVDEIEVVIDSNEPRIRTEYLPGFSAGIDHTSISLLRPGDIVFVRGGFKAWLPFIDYCREKKFWLLFYGANTGRERWPFWDVIFDDLSGKGDRTDQTGRLWLDYRKPVNEAIFRHNPVAEPAYDLCIGASYIHDKKGQWRGVAVAAAYKELFGKNLLCVLPGAFRRGEKTNRIMHEIISKNLDILIPGMLSRRELANILNCSKLFCHLGSGGQGDRGPIEAMRCGCPVIIGFPQYHAPWVCKDTEISFIPDDPDDYQAIARHIYEWLQAASERDRKAVSDSFDRWAGIESVTIPRMKRLFDCLRQIPWADRQTLREAYGL